MVFVAICPVQDIDRVWNVAAPLLEDAVRQSDGRYDLPSVKEMVSTGHSQLWIIADTRLGKDLGSMVVAAGVSYVANYPAKKMLNIPFLGGSQMESWLAYFIEKLRDFASHNGASGIELVGRPGWSKVLNKFEFKLDKAVLMEASL